MRRDRTIANRMRDMLTMDNVGVKNGFACALGADINRVLRDYFDMEHEAQISISQGDEGKYEISIKGRARRIKNFATTMDERRF